MNFNDIDTSHWEERQPSLIRRAVVATAMAALIAISAVGYAYLKAPDSVPTLSR